MATLAKPEPFLEILVHDLSLDPTLTGLCVCYESGNWRTKQFADHLFEWLPEFALTWREIDDFRSATAVALLRRAAHVVYATDKYGRRGEFGELLLHVAMRQVFDSVPAISKLYFKDAANDTVKGFDAVHVVHSGEQLELWLGEAKLYSDLSAAIRAAVDSLAKAIEVDYLRAEFAAILNKLDPEWPQADRLRLLLSPNTSLDRVFDILRIPVLLTYDSAVVAGHAEHDNDYETAFDAEARDAHQQFASAELPSVAIHLVLVPLASKDKLVEALHEKLQTWQKI